MLLVQRVRKPFSHMLTALDVAHQTVLSPLNAGACVPRLQKQIGMYPSCILVLCHAGTCRRGRSAWTGCALKRRASAVHHVYAIIMFTLSVWRRDYLMKVIFSELRCSAVGRTVIRQGSVLGFSANRVWLVSRFYICISLHYYKTRAFSIPTINTLRLCVLLWRSGLGRRSVDSEVRATQVRSSYQDFLNLI